MDKSKAALKYLGVPYQHQGRSTAGMDCVGLIIAVGRDLGIDMNDQDYPYLKIPDPTVLLSGMMNNFMHKPGSSYEPGDIIVFRIRRNPQHVGIILENNKLIHSYENVGKVVMHDMDQRWVKRIAAVFSYE